MVLIVWSPGSRLSIARNVSLMQVLSPCPESNERKSEVWDPAGCVSGDLDAHSGLRTLFYVTGLLGCEHKRWQGNTLANHKPSGKHLHLVHELKNPGIEELHPQMCMRLCRIPPKSCSWWETSRGECTAICSLARWHGCRKKL